ncbi:Protein kinase-like domain [Cordyceps militaris CM01]|uniref:Protein kinase-like domain n=1 Tax=Cordyceps militaris (strain CM01) TaxID=983644 RepID=G3J9X2_CORMM|nr:Protein kinase-like domain [Cordyceps militaris CM01]EGX94195.1 Protein kinase-like domain [Cordyceps militaris CM01]
MHTIIDHFTRVPWTTIVLGKLSTAWNAVLRFLSSALRFWNRSSITQSCQYPLTYEQQEARNDEFVARINKDAIATLVSRHCEKPCQINDFKRGSFNVCFFVGVLQGDSQWTVRVPIEPAVHDTWGKIQNEVATMQYVRDRTTIPLPDVHTWGREALTRDLSTRQAYVILEYVPGRPLNTYSLAKDTRDRRDYVYSQLIDFFAQMRQLELPSAGSLMPDSNGGPDPVIGPFLSRHINELQVQRPKVATPSAPFTSTEDFVLHQLSLIEEAIRLPLGGQSFKDAQREVFALENLRQVLTKSIQVNARNDGPFVLCHLDLRGPNIIVDEDLKFMGILDWEFTGSIPVEHFIPPFWIAGKDLTYATGGEYRTEFTQFHKILLAKSETSDVHRRLAEEWNADLPYGMRLPIAELLHHHSQLLSIFFQAIYPQLFQGPEKEVVAAFFERGENQALALEVQRQFESSEAYTQYLKINNWFEPDDQEEIARAALVQQIEQQMEKLKKFKTTKH